MNETKALEIVNSIFKNVFGVDNTFSLDEIKEKFAFDVKLPIMVHDYQTGEETWTSLVNGEKFITQMNMENKADWMLQKKNITSLEELLEIWNSINALTTQRVYDSLEVCKSDTIYGCENVYNSSDCIDSKNIVFCDSCNNLEYVLASQRSNTLTYCIRTDDSQKCSNCYNVIYSNKITNSLFIQDSFDLDECMFCSHIANKKYCIANMQFEKEEYFEIKKAIISWILNSS